MSHTVTIYPSYGYFDKAAQTWNIRMRIWVHSRHEGPVWLLNAGANELVSHYRGVGADEVQNYKERIEPFQHESHGDRVQFSFREDPENVVWEFKIDGQPVKADANGVIEGTLTLNKEQGDKLLEAQGDGWLTLEVHSQDHFLPGKRQVGGGQVRLIKSGPGSVGVISDIDDTVKVTGIPDGWEVVLKKTFLLKFEAATEMLPDYAKWETRQYPFFYVSGGFWQLQEPLEKFFATAGIPKGTFHMRHLPLNPLSISTVRGIKELLPDEKGEGGTFKHKVDRIKQIMTDFPDMHFILVGDSGEKDPEVYGAIKEDPTFAPRVDEVIIRDVLAQQKRLRVANRVIEVP